LVSYLIGSIPTSLLITRWVRGIDIREHGSGNIGATNAFRVIGKKWGAVSLIIDVLKGFIPVSMLASSNPNGMSYVVAGTILGFCAIAGHNWPVWLSFKGGKGVATSLGVFLAILPKAALSALGVFAITVLITNFISVGSIVASFAFLIFTIIFYSKLPEFIFILVLALFLMILIVYMHRPNIQRLRSGTENKVFKRGSNP